MSSVNVNDCMVCETPRHRAVKWVETGIGHLFQCPLTLAITAVAILTACVQPLSVWFQLDVSAVAGGQWWRLLTGHVAHFGPQHLFWDLLMFAALGSACERRHPKSFGPGLLLMSLVVSAGVLLYCPDVSRYRGLSGIDTGLFVWFVGDQIRCSLASRDRPMTAIWMVAGSMLVGKLIFEMATGQILFVDASSFRPLVESHLAGAAVGILLTIGSGWKD